MPSPAVGHGAPVARVPGRLDGPADGIGDLGRGGGAPELVGRGDDVHPAILAAATASDHRAGPPTPARRDWGMIPG